MLIKSIIALVGWLEGGLSASFEKFTLDAEMIQMLVETLKPLNISEETLGFSAIQEVGPGGHFFGAADTLTRYDTAFYEPMLSDWQNFAFRRLPFTARSFFRNFQDMVTAK